MSNNCKIIKEALYTGEVLYDNTLEQAVEMDIALPDYAPEIFKVLSLELSSNSSIPSLSGTKLSFDIEADATVLYCSEDGKICSAHGRAIYSEAAEIAYAVKNPQIKINTSVASQSYKVMSKRRVTVNGLIKADINITQDTPTEAIGSAVGMGLELLKEQITFPSKRICVTKRIVIADEVDIPAAKSAIGSVLKAEAVGVNHDKKALSGKLLIKGEAQVGVLYLPQEGDIPETLTVSLPFSQILDIEALDERYEIYTEAVAKSCVASVSSRNDSRSISISIDVEITCRAAKFDTKEFALDAFSTVGDVNLTPLDVKVEGMPTPLNTSFKKKATLTYKDGEVGEVISISGRVGCLTYKTGENNLYIGGRLYIGAFACDESGKPIYLETTTDFEEKLPLDNAAEIKVYACAEVGSVQYNIMSSNSVDVTVLIKVCGYTTAVVTKQLIGDISVNEQTADKGEYGLKLYYSQAGESVWNIAKRCRTSAKGIRKENGIDGDRVDGARVLLVPYFN